MIYYIESKSVDPYYNLALEQFVFDRLNREHGYFMLWQNHNSIIVGKHQNTQEEINAAFVKEKNITVARRLSGGGAVYHDLGNLNYTFISNVGTEKISEPYSLFPIPYYLRLFAPFSVFCEPIRDALRSFGVPAEISGRNDMTVEGKKFSGSAQYIKQNRVMHHGTILYDSDLAVLSKALKPGNDKIESKGIKSVLGRVTNIRPYMKSDMTAAEFWAALKDRLSAAFGLHEISLTDEHLAAVEELRESVYSKWSWNYGNSPPYTIRKSRRIEGCGKIDIYLDIGREGEIKNIAFYGDFFSTRDPAELGKILAGHHLECEELKAVLADVNISGYFHGMKKDVFIALLLE